MNTDIETNISTMDILTLSSIQTCNDSPHPDSYRYSLQYNTFGACTAKCLEFLTNSHNFCQYMHKFGLGPCFDLLFFLSGVT